MLNNNNLLTFKPNTLRNFLTILGNFKNFTTMSNNLLTFKSEHYLSLIGALGVMVLRKSFITVLRTYTVRRINEVKFSKTIPEELPSFPLGNHVVDLFIKRDHYLSK